MSGLLLLLLFTIELVRLELGVEEWIDIVGRSFWAVVETDLPLD